MLVGYARVSTDLQTTDGQIDALNAAGCERVFQELMSGTRADRPQLAAALGFAREGDVLVVARLDRLARSMRQLLTTVDVLQARGIGLRSLHENIDTTSATGRLIFHVFTAIGQFEVELLRERTRTALAASRARGRGRVGGRPPALDAIKVRAAKAMLASGTMTAAEEAAYEAGVGKNNAHDIVRFLAHRVPEIWRTVEAAANQTASRTQVYEYPVRFGPIIKWYKPKPKPKPKADGADDHDDGNRSRQELERDLLETNDRLKELQERVATAESRAGAAAADTDRYRNLFHDAQDKAKDAAEREAAALAWIAAIETERQTALNEQAKATPHSRQWVEQWWAAIIAELETELDRIPDQPFIGGTVHVFGTHQEVQFGPAPEPAEPEPPPTPAEPAPEPKLEPSAKSARFLTTIRPGAMSRGRYWAIVDAPLTGFADFQRQVDTLMNEAAEVTDEGHAVLGYIERLDDGKRATLYASAVHHVPDQNPALISVNAVLRQASIGLGRKRRKTKRN